MQNIASSLHNDDDASGSGGHSASVRTRNAKKRPRNAKHRKVMPPNKYLTTGAAADELGVSTQTVRNFLRASSLQGAKSESGRWRVDAASVEEYLAANGSKLERPDTRDRIDELTVAVRELSARDVAAERLVADFQRERDRYRADAAAAKGAALAVNAAARELDHAVRSMLEVLAAKSQRRVLCGGERGAFRHPVAVLALPLQRRRHRARRSMSASTRPRAATWLPCATRRNGRRGSRMTDRAPSPPARRRVA